MRLTKICEHLNKWFVRIGIVAVVGMVGLASANIFLRLFGHPWKGTYEVVGFLGALVFAFGLGYAQLTRSHIAVDILDPLYPKWVKSVVDGIGSIVSFVLFAILSWRLFLYSTLLLKTGEKSDTLRVVFYPFSYCLSVCFGFFALVLLADFFSTLEKAKRRERRE